MGRRFPRCRTQRANEIDFTPAYVEIEATYLLPPGSPLKSVAEVDRKGVRIAVPERSAYELWLTRNIKNAELVRIKGADETFKRFVDEKMDALAGLRPRLVTDTKTCPARAYSKAISPPSSRQPARRRAVRQPSSTSRSSSRTSRPPAWWQRPSRKTTFAA
jgi:hypothetical protein